MESVWDYPRPPRLEASRRLVRVEFAGEVIAETTRAYRVLETSHPPVYYIPPEDVRSASLRPSRRHSFCEWKGTGELLRPCRRRARGPRRRLVLPGADLAVRGDPRLRRLLSQPRRRGLRRRRAGAGPGGRLLRRLDHRRDRGALQGRAGHGRLVTRPEDDAQPVARPRCPVRGSRSVSPSVGRRYAR